MFVYVTKLFWLIFSPLSIVLILFALGTLLSFSRFRRLSRAALLLGLVWLSLISLTNLGDLLIRPLETRFPRPPEPTHIDGIIVLGGGMDSAVNTLTGGWEFNQNGDRFVEALRLAQTHPEAKVLVSSGVAVGSIGTEPEALAAGRFFRAFGIPDSRLLLETASRNTEENAEFSYELAKPKPGETWLLVTSGFHMPRSMDLFRRVKFPVIPWGTDYMTGADAGPELRPTTALDNIMTLNSAIREWSGLIGYWLAGRIDSPFPSP